MNETMGVSASLSEGKILLTGLVMKKCGWIFYKPRQLILKDNHRLLYYDPQTNKLKVIKAFFDNFEWDIGSFCFGLNVHFLRVR